MAARGAELGDRRARRSWSPGRRRRRRSPASSSSSTLAVGVLDDRLDHQVAVGQVLGVGGHLDVARRRRRRPWRRASCACSSAFQAEASERASSIVFEIALAQAASPQAIVPLPAIAGRCVCIRSAHGAGCVSRARLSGGPNGHRYARLACARDAQAHLRVLLRPPLEVDRDRRLGRHRRRRRRLLGQAPGRHHRTRTRTTSRRRRTRPR